MKGLISLVGMGTFVIVLFLTFVAFDVSAGEKISLTIPYKATSNQERIDTFKITVRGVWVYSLPKVPKGWSIEIQDLGYAIEIKGYASHGADMAYPTFFEDFIVFETIDTVPQLKVPFHVESEITVDLGPDVKKPRKVIFGKEALLLRRLAP